MLKWESLGYNSSSVKEPILPVDRDISSDSGSLHFVYGDCTQPSKVCPSENTIIFRLDTLKLESTFIQFVLNMILHMNLSNCCKQAILLIFSQLLPLIFNKILYKSPGIIHNVPLGFISLWNV